MKDYAGRASAAGLPWPLPEGLDDAALEAALSPCSLVAVEDEREAMLEGQFGLGVDRGDGVPST